jgi:hypothetical protein
MKIIHLKLAFRGWGPSKKTKRVLEKFGWRKEGKIPIYYLANAINFTICSCCVHTFAEGLCSVQHPRGYCYDVEADILADIATMWKRSIIVAWGCDG